ncbi:MAG TPA: arylsulfotransferase family protein [Ignavibacteriaceae bacterium]|nr:arylsulfotransferase family protein [Ignavibacteriaceae bacterium]
MKNLLLLIFLFPGFFLVAQTSNVSKFRYISPVPGSHLVTPETNIIIRPGEPLAPFNLNDTTILIVNGNISGPHSGKFYLTEDSKTLVFQPDLPFSAGDSVSVHLNDSLKTQSGKNLGTLDFSFNVTSDNGCEILLNYKSISWLPGTNTSSNKSGNTARADSSLLYPSNFPEISAVNNFDSKPEEGYYFLALNLFENNFLTILNNNGIPIFIKREPSPVYDFKIQPNRMLTYYLKKDSTSKFYGLDSLYAVVDSFYTGNGLYTDFHDLQVLPDGHAFMIAYDSQPVQMDTVINTRTDTACLTGCVIQEIDKSKNVVWQWRSWDHYKITDSEYDLYQNNIPYCHVNSIDIIDDTTAIISTRYFNEITKINRITGDIIWRFGGKNNQFNIAGSGPDFQYQHDARYIGNDNFSLYDNTPPNSGKYSRGLIYHLNVANKTGSMVKEIYHNPGLFGKNMGNLQVTHEGNMVIGWGNIGFDGKIGKYIFSEYDSTGKISNDVTLSSPTFVFSYRAVKFPWETKLITSDKSTLEFPINSRDTTGTFKITNNGKVPLNITGIYNKNSLFQASDLFPIKFEPGSEVSLSITFSPNDTSKVIDTAYVVTRNNDQTMMVYLPIILNGNSETTSIEDNKSGLPKLFNLSQNYPNPFNPSTIIEYSIPTEQLVTLTIYDILGRLVKTLVNSVKEAGNYRIEFNPANFSNGVYFYKLRAGNFTSVKKMILLK